MIKENKLKVAISLFVTILPMIVGFSFWGKFVADDALMRSVKITGIVVIPIAMLLVNAFCIIFTHFETKKNPQHKKIITMILWIIPSLSVYVNLIFCSVLFRWNVNIQLISALIIGVLLMLSGNYMPKCKQSRTFGVKIRWTLANEDNWNATHRFTGKTWFATGFVVVLLGFLPLKACLIAFVFVIFAVAFLPVLYSYLYYKNNLKSGKQSKEDYKFYSKKADKVALIITAIAVPIVLVGCAILMFTGNIEFTLTEDSLKIEAAYHQDESISYADIDSVEYRENADKGTRIMGFASARLLLGAFSNDDYGAFTRFSYTKCKSDIIIKAGDSIIAISCESESETRALYESLSSKLGK